MIEQKLKVLFAGILICATYCSTSLRCIAIRNESKVLTAPKKRVLILPQQAKIIDLTQTINASVPTYDGKAENFKYQTLSSVDKDGYASGAFFIHEHLGTHIDAPSHFSTGGITIDQIDTNDLLLSAIVIDAREEVKKDPDYLLTVEKIKEFERNKNIPPHSAVLLLSGWSKRYFVDGEYRNADSKGVMHFPGFSFAAAKYLIDNLKVATLGIDTLSIDHGPSEDFAVHKFVLAKGLFMVENLTNLEQLPSSGALILFAPLKIEGGTGSPARVIALVPQK